MSFFENEHLDEYLYASGRTLTEADVAILENELNLLGYDHYYLKNKKKPLFMLWVVVSQ